jgi:hypothetical protein
VTVSIHNRHARHDPVARDGSVESRTTVPQSYGVLGASRKKADVAISLSRIAFKYKGQLSMMRGERSCPHTARKDKKTE